MIWPDWRATRMKPLIRTGLTLLLAVSVVCVVQRGPSAAAAGPAVTISQVGKETAPRPEPISLPSESSTEIKELDNQIAALRKEFHSQLDPLEAQLKALREKY